MSCAACLIVSASGWPTASWLEICSNSATTRVKLSAESDTGCLPSWNAIAKPPQFGLDDGFDIFTLEDGAARDALAAIAIQLAFVEHPADDVRLYAAEPRRF